MFLRFAAANGEFSGTTDVYARPGALTDLAAAMAGFPSSVSDTRACEFGSRWGFFRVEMRCVDRAGHPAARITIAAGPPAEEARFEIAALPAQIDEFIADLRRAARGDQEEASLGTGT